MFGDESLLFDTRVPIDSKKRITIPAKSKVEYKEKLVLRETEDGNLAIYSIKEYEDVLALLKRAIKREQSKGNTTKKEKFRCEYNLVCSRLLDTQTVDIQHRIILSPLIREKYNLEDEVYLEGEYDHINIFNSEESYENYKEFVKKRS